MKKLKSQNGIITMVTLISMLFLVSFLMSSYVIVANKVKTQKEIVKETEKIYKPTYTMEEIYNSYFSADSVIPIYTVEQLLLIGQGNKQVDINGKIYAFTNSSSYALKNNLKIDSNYLGFEEDWIPIAKNINFNGKFEGNGNTITVTQLNGDIKIYSEENNYGEFSTNWILAETTPEEWNGNISAMTDGAELIPLPKGFNISGENGEDIIEDGLVITDQNKNEFVWIPVENAVIDISDRIKTIDTITVNYGASNSWKLVKDAITEKVDLSSKIYPMAAKIGEEGKEHYIGVSYSFDENGNINSLAILNGGTSYMEPRAMTNQYAYKTGTQYDAIYSNILMAMTDEEITQMSIDQNSTNEECATYFYNKLQNDFDKMVNSVVKYGGFYVGRYETTGFSDEVITIRPEEIYRGITNNWYTMYKKQKEFSDSITANSIESNMIWGCQYDQIMKFVNGKNDGNGEFYNVGTAGARNSGNEQIGSGYTQKDKVANIFDLEGCRYEWTAEANNISCRTARGGKYNDNKSASYRSLSTNMPTTKNGNNASRIILYIK